MHEKDRLTSLPSRCTYVMNSHRSDNLLESGHSRRIQQAASAGRRSCVRMFIIISALLSHLAPGAAFDLISDLDKVITVCHIPEQWC